MSVLEFLSTVLVLVVFLLILMTLLYFIHFQVKKRQRAHARFLHPLEGRYLERYVPLDLRPHYEAELAKKRAEMHRRAGWFWKRRKALAAFSVLFLGTQPASADKGSHANELATATIEKDSNSDQAERTSLTAWYNSDAKDLLWPYPNEAESGWHFGVGAERHTGRISDITEFEGVKLNLGAGKKHGPNLLLEGFAALHLLRVPGKDINTQRGVPAARAIFSPAHNFWLIAQVKNDFIYQEMLLPAGAIDALSATTVRLDIVSRPLDSCRILGRTSERWFNDSNYRQEHDLAILYGFATTSPWIWLGAGANYLGYSNRHANLWTPSQFLSYGPRAEATLPVWKNISSVFEGQWNFSQEDQLTPQQGYAVAMGLRHGIRGQLETTALYRESRTNAYSSGYSSFGGYLNVAGSF